jgi:pimeloyl-ACP methyl ester carboxylesterase
MAMRTFFQGVAVEIARAESSRFRHPILFVHGLWTGNWIWRGLMGYLAHRGWDSWAPSFLEGVPDPSAARLDQLVALCRTLSAPPVIVAHDAGAMVAMSLASAVEAPAVVAIAPLLSRRDAATAGLFAWPQFWIVRVIGRNLLPPTGAGRALYLDPRLDEPDLLRPDSGADFRRLASGTLRFADDTTAPPTLLIASRGDAITRARQLQLLATRRGWSFHCHPAAGHFPTVEPGWERLADDVHRWLVQTLGERLLAFVEDDEDRE